MKQSIYQISGNIFWSFIGPENLRTQFLSQNMIWDPVSYKSVSYGKKKSVTLFSQQVWNIFLEMSIEFFVLLKSCALCTYQSINGLSSCFLWHEYQYIIIFCILSLRAKRATESCCELGRISMSGCKLFNITSYYQLTLPRDESLYII